MMTFRSARVLFAALLFAAVFQTAEAQLYILHRQARTVGEYDATSGAIINPALVAGLGDPSGIAYYKGALFITQNGMDGASLSGGGLVGKFDARTGAALNPGLITGLTCPQTATVEGNNLYVSSLDGSGTGMVGKYDATTGAVINALFISRLVTPLGLAVRENHLYVYCMSQGIGDFDATTGEPINPHLCRIAGLFVTQSGDSIWTSDGSARGGAVFKYNAGTGANEVGFRTPLVRGKGGSVAVLGDVLYVGNPETGVVSTYNASTGASINPKFIDAGDIRAIAIVPSDAPIPLGTKLADTATSLFSKNTIVYIQVLIYSFPGLAAALGLGVVLALVALAVFIVRSRRKRPRPAAPEGEVPVKAAPPPLPVGNRTLVLVTGVVFALIAGTVALVYLVAVPFYIRQISAARTAGYVQAEKEADAHSAALPPPVIPKPLPRETLPAVLADPENYRTENNWIAAMIGQRIAEAGALVQHPGAPPADVKVHAQVVVDPPQVHLDVNGFASSPITIDLRPDFAWDAAGYAPMVASLFGGKIPRPDAPDEPLPDELKTLEDLTGPNLAREDVALSALLQKHPAWPAAHENAALVLVGLALRDRAGQYTDARPMLSRATAHLALARAFRGTAPATWAGEIADAGIRALSGRAKDALARLDTLAARPDCPGTAKAWIMALRLRATDKWSLLTPDATTPLVELIAWSQALNDNLDAAGADARLQKIGPLPQVSDWGHASITNWIQSSVQTDNNYCQSSIQQDLQDLADILQTEGTPLDTSKPIGVALAEPLTEHLFTGQPASLRIIGPDMFKDFARRHLLNEIGTTYFWLLKELGDPDGAESFHVAMQGQFKDMRRFENLHFFGDPGAFNPRDVLEEVHRQNKTWFPWELAAGLMPGNQNLANIHPNIDTLDAFYQDGLPFGTAYNLAGRSQTLYIGASYHKPQNLQDINYNLGTYPYAKDLRALAPDSYDAYLLDANRQTTFQDTKPWWDYDVRAIEEAEQRANALSDDDYTLLLQKQAALEPASYFTLGDHLRKQGKDDDAAVADRKGFDQDNDEVGMSDCVGPLVDYYFDHGRTADAEVVAKRAAGVYSASGLMIYCRLLEKMNRFDEAEKLAQDMAERYNMKWVAESLYAAHPDAFPEQHTVLLDKTFPNGLKRVSIDSFSTVPVSGCEITSESPQLQQASMQVHDVVVGLDGYQVENDEQYDYVRALTRSPKMDLIVWRDGKYLEVHTSMPDRRFHVDMNTYTGPAIIGK